MKQRIEAHSRPLQPKEAAQILRAIRTDSLRDCRDYALLLTGLATGLRKIVLLNLRVKQVDDLPVAVRAAITVYLRQMPGVCQPNDLIFPNLPWHCLQRNFAISMRTFLLILKARAELAGIDPARIGSGTWHRTAAVIRLQPGGFEAFAAALNR